MNSTCHALESRAASWSFPVTIVGFGKFHRLSGPLSLIEGKIILPLSHDQDTRVCFNYAGQADHTEIAFRSKPVGFFVSQVQSALGLSLIKALERAALLLSRYGERLEFDISMQGTKLSLIRKESDMSKTLSLSDADWSKQIELLDSKGNVPSSKSCKTSKEQLDRILTIIVKDDRLKYAPVGVIPTPRMLFNSH